MPRLAGHRFAVHIGLVDQDALTPIGSTFAYRMQEADLRRIASDFETTSNADLGFYAEDSATRRCTILLKDFNDDVGGQNLTDLNLSLVEGVYYRLALCPRSTFGAIDTINDTALCYLFPAVRLAEGGWHPDARAGQPNDLMFHSRGQYCLPGETTTTATLIQLAWTW